MININDRKKYIILLLMSLLAFLLFVFVKSRSGFYFFGDGNASLWRDNIYFFNTHLWYSNDNGYFLPLVVISLPFQFIFKIFTIFFDVYFLSILYFYGAIFSLVLANMFLLRNICKKCGIISYLIICLFVISNPISASLIFAQTDIAYSISFITFLISYLFYCRNKNEINLRDGIILSILILFINCYVLNTVLLMLVLAAYFLIFHWKYLINHKSQIALLLAFLFLINFFWIITLLYNTFFSGENPGNSLVFYSNSSADAVLSISSNQINYFLPFIFSNSYIQDPNHSAEFFSRNYIIAAGFIITIVVFFIHLIYRHSKSRNDKKLIIFLLSVFAIFYILSLGVKSPFGNVFFLLWNYIPGFNLFRSIFKFQFVLYFVFVILLAFSLKYADKKWIKAILLASVLTLSSFYFLNPHYKKLTKTFKIPDYYWINEAYLNSKKLLNTYKIFPDEYFSSRFIYTQFDWNTTGWDSANIIRIFTNQVTDFVPFSGRIADKHISRQLCSREYKGTRNIDYLTKILGILNIKNIVMQNDVEPKNTSCLDPIDQYQKKTIGKLDIYTLDNNNFIPLIYTPEEIIVSERGGEDAFSRIISSDDYKIRSAIFFKKQNDGEKDVLEKIYENNAKPPVIEIRKINPTKYRIRVHKANQTFPLVFSQSFHNGWKAYLTRINAPNSQKPSLNDYKIMDGNEEDQASTNELKEYLGNGMVSTMGNGREINAPVYKWNDGEIKTDGIKKYKIDYISKNFQGTIQNNNLPDGNFFETWFKNPIEDKKHLIVNGYANSWILNPQSLCSREATKCIKNNDGSYDFEIVLEFWPQRLEYIGLGISGLVLLSGIAYLVLKRKKKYS